MVCLWMSKTTEAKPHQVNLRLPLLRIHSYQNKRFQVKGIPVPNTNLQLTPYPNTQLDLQCSDNLSFQCTAPSTWLTNWCTDPTWERCWLQSFSVHPTMKIKKLLGYKTLGAKTQQLLQRIWWTRANSISGHNLHAQSICIELHHFASPLMAFKIILIYV